MFSLIDCPVSTRVASLRLPLTGQPLHTERQALRVLFPATPTTCITPAKLPIVVSKTGLSGCSSSALQNLLHHRTRIPSRHRVQHKDRPKYFARSTCV
ncbi:unnamed protein product [Periconia digitata]|uniref:Uncharacterized protein n=1 Tax=Periconia digitata TaxID=1303443 RepID=A0A9W4UUS0_9PLEO|nr:unnamed protein product [Periconia digitata]